MFHLDLYPVKMNDVSIFIVEVSSLWGLKGDLLNFIRTSIFFLVIHGKKMTVDDC